MKRLADDGAVDDTHRMWSLALPWLVIASAPIAPLSLERIHDEPPLAGRSPVQAKLSPGGSYVTYLKASAASQEVLDLWAQPLPAGSPFALVTTSDLLGGGEQKLTEAEKMQLERKRISQRGITGYSWCGNDDRRLLFPFSGDLYLAELADRGHPPRVVRLTHDDRVAEQNPVCSAAGDAVAYVKEGNVVVLDVATREARPLTTGASETRFFGLAEFIAQEELDRHEGMWWSPDGKSLLVLEVDESGVGVKMRPQIFADRTEMVAQRYPAAGEKNAVVTAHLVQRASQTRTTVKMPPRTTHPVEYIARAGFLDDGTPYLLGLSRDQTTLWGFLVDATGTARVAFEEHDSAWVELHDDLRSLDDGGLLWSSEASGRRQLVRLDRRTGARAPLSSQSEPVASVVCASRQHLVFAAFADRGRRQHLYVLADGQVRALTSGASFHTATADRSCTHLLVTSSTWGVPPSTSLVVVRTGATLLTLGSPVDAPDPLLTASQVSSPRFVDVVAADGKTTLNGRWLPPAPGKKPLAPGSVPVIVHAYGGPTGHLVAHRYMRLTPLFTHWQQRGFGVFVVDTRGMAGRDRAFTKAHKNAFGRVEIDDVMAAARQLPSIAPEVDPARIGFFGWSYGGYVAAGVMLDEATPFAAGVGVAPVTDWRLYDTAYTERYIGLPGESGDAPNYRDSNLVSRAHRLDKPLLLVHGTADDNVLFEHTLRLVSALEEHGRLFDLAIYPGKAHGISGSKTQLHLHRTITAFFVETLRP